MSKNNPPSEKMVKAISPEGVKYLIPDSEMEEAKKHGWKTNQGEDSPLGAIGAALAGAARTAIPFSPTSFIAPEKQRALKEQYPVASGLGETLGLFAPVPLGGITGKIASPLLRTAAIGALSGLGSGAGEEISRAMLGDDELRAENILASGAAGAALGGAIGAGIHGIGKLGKSILSKIAQKKTDSLLQSVGFTPAQFKKNTARRDAISQTILKDNLLKWSAKDALISVLSKRDKIGGKIGDLKKRVIQNSKERNFDASSMFNEIDEKIKKPLLDSLVPAKKQLVEDLDKNLSLLKEHTQNTPFVNIKTMLDFRPHLDDAINDLASQGEVTKARRAPLRQARKIIEKHIEKYIKETPDVKISDYKKLKRHYANLETIQESLEKREAQEAATPFLLPKFPHLSLSSTALGGVMGGVQGAATGYAAELAGEKIKNKIPYLGAKAAVQAEKLAAKTDFWVRNLVTPQASKIAARAQINDEQTKEVINQVDTLSKNPEALQKIVGFIDDPIAGAKYAAGIQYLAANLPESMRTLNANSISPLKYSKNSRVSRVELNKFKNRYSGFSDPINTIERAVRGKASPEAIESVKIAYPRLYNTMISKILEDLADKDVPYQSRINLSALTGTTLDDSLTPQSIANIQGSYGTGDAQRTPPSSRKTPVDFYNNSMTQSQRIQERKK